jgi:lipopolysaccharide heptosyltransferase II
MSPASLECCSPRRIVIIKPSALGDVVQSLPLLPALRQRFPQAHLAWVIQSGLEDLLTNHPDLDEVLLFRRRSWTDWQPLLRSLWSGRFDLAIDLQGLLRTGIMTAMTAAPIRLGLNTAREGSRWTLTHLVPGTGRKVAAWERYLRVLDAVGADRRAAEFKIATATNDAAWADGQLAGIRRPVIAVHPGARWETKRWPVDRFADVLASAVRAWNAGIVVLGSAGERDLAAALENRLAERGMAKSLVNLAGATTLKQLAAILQRVDAVLSNDSGPMHFAAGLGTPTLGVFTCTDPVRSGPAGSAHATVTTGLKCGGSYRKRCPHHGSDHLACFRELDSARVWSALKRLMEARPMSLPSRAA